MTSTEEVTDKRILGTAAELIRLVGESLGTTAWSPVEQARIDAFADATDDHQWIHIDRQRAAEGPFGGTIAHGMLTLSLVPRLVTELIDVENARLVVNCGFDRVRFLQPVPAQAEIRGQVTLLKAIAVDGGVRATFATAVQIKGQERPACVADLVLQWMDPDVSPSSPSASSVATASA